MELTSNNSTATPRSSGGNRKRTGHKAPNMRVTNGREVDAIKNPTQLFQKINSGDWEGALDALYERPVDASVWVSRQMQSEGQNSGDADISWKYLPLHLICLQKRPPLTLLQQLLQAYPGAASMSTPHDGNLPIHYACESGCDSRELLSGVLAALLDAFPQSLEAKNFKGRTPLLLCSVKTRHVLMGVLRARKQTVAGKKNKNEHRSDVSGYSARDKALLRREHRHPPPLNAHLLPPLIDGDDSDSNEEEAEDNSEEDSMQQIDKKTASHPSRSNRYASNSRNLADRSTDSEDELRAQLEALANQNKSQQLTIAKLSDRLKRLTNSQDDDTVAEDAKLLCQRILAKAEADSVNFRTQIQQIQAENEKLKQDASIREKMVLESLMSIRDVLSGQGDKMKLNLFNEDTDFTSESTANQDPSTKHSSLSDQVIEALGTVFSHVEMNEDKLRSQVKSLEVQLSDCEVKHKTAQSSNQALIKKQRDLERNINQLQDEKKSIEQSLADAKEKNSSLVVMNRTLQEQIDTPRLKHSENGVGEYFQFNDVDSEQEENGRQSFQLIQQTLEENKSTIATLLQEQEVLKEKNRSLKDTILMNNEKYLNKVQELGEKYSDLEKVNSELRERINKSSTIGRARSSLKVSLEGEDELLYEV